MRGLSVVALLWLSLAAATPASATVTFSSPVRYPVGDPHPWSIPSGIVTGDFTNSGRTDIITANGLGGPQDPAQPQPNFGTGDVSLLLNQGTGTFGAPQNYDAQDGPSSVAAGDLNGDGKQDLVVANSGSNSITVLINQGNGSFAPGVSYPVGQTPEGVAIGDFNGDHKPDVAVVSCFDNSLWILLNRGDGTLGTPTAFDTGGGGPPVNLSFCPNAVSVGDFNGDQKLDLVIPRAGEASNGDSDAVVMLGNGDGTFKISADISLGDIQARQAVVADFNKDGNEDIAVALDGGVMSNTCCGGSVAVALGNGDGTFQPVHLYQGDNGPMSITAGDFDGDGNVDLAVTNGGTLDVSVLLGDGAGGFGKAENFQIEDPSCQSACPPGPPGLGDVTSADLTGDGRSELILGDWPNNAVAVLVNTTVNPVAASLTYGGPTSGTVGAPVALSATLTTSTGAALVGERLTLGLGTESCSATTGAGGNANCMITPVDNPGRYAVTIRFLGDTSQTPTVAGATYAGTSFKLSAAPPPAGARIYWADQGLSSVGNASVTGAGVNRVFIAGVSNPDGVAIDGTHIYWSNIATGTIGRANLDGSNTNPSFITGAHKPAGIAVDANHIYWANNASGTIGRADLDGRNVNQSFIGHANFPSYVALDGTQIYWANNGSGTIGRANLDGSGADQSFISGAQSPTGVAVDGAHLYWANAGTGTIGRANLDGSGVNQSLLSGGNSIEGLAVDDDYIYWANNGTGTIGRANRDGTDPNQAFLATTGGLGGLAVSVPVAELSPSAPLAFETTQVGTQSAPQSLTITNTGQRDLLVSAVSLTGAHAGDFVVSTDTCQTPVAPGRSCHIAVTFAPATDGAWSASLEIVTNDFARSPLRVALSGTGATRPPAPPPPAAPTAAAHSYKTRESTALFQPAPGVLAGATGETGLQAVLVTGSAKGGAVSLGPDGSFTYAPKPGFFGTDTFTYAVTDPDGAKSAPATATIKVTATRHAPSRAAEIRQIEISYQRILDDYRRIVAGTRAIIAHIKHPANARSANTGLATAATFARRAARFERSATVASAHINVLQATATARERIAVARRYAAQARALAARARAAEARALSARARAAEARRRK